MEIVDRPKNRLSKKTSGVATDLTEDVLREELEIIFSTWSRPIVMIDDFAVPESAYGYDDYGPGKTLDLSYIDHWTLWLDLSILIRTMPSVVMARGR